jgi:hypothetical protein
VAVGHDLVADRVGQQVTNPAAELALLDGAAPGHIARVGRSGFGLQDGAGVGGNAVGADEQVVCGRGPIGEPHLDVLTLLAKAAHLLAEVVATSSEAAQQRTVDGVPGRVPIPPRFLEHHSAVPTEVAQEARGGREPPQLQVGPLRK